MEGKNGNQLKFLHCFSKSVDYWIHANCHHPKNVNREHKSINQNLHVLKRKAINSFKKHIKIYHCMSQALDEHSSAKKRIIRF